MAELLRAVGLEAGYGDRRVLHGVSFRLYAGELCALLGSNGCGKSTLLRALCGLLPYRGSCLLEGEELRNLTQRQQTQRIAYLTQRGGVSLSLSALDVVLMGYNPVLGLLERPSRAQVEHAKHMLEEIAGPGVAGRDFAALSEGQKQMVLFARTLLRDTRLLLLDEPDSAVDFPNRRRMLSLLRQRAQQRGEGVLLCSHDVNLALRYAQRLLLLKEGRLLCGVRVDAVPPAELAEALSQLYGPVEVLRHGGYFIMTGDERD